MEEYFLEYGDIIHITSQTEALNDKKFLIEYIDSKHIRIVNKDGTHELNLEEDGSFSDLTITSVRKISSSPEKGVAIQKGLVTGKTIEIKFVPEDFPDIVGIISNLENDRIEITLEAGKTNLIVDATHQPIESQEIIYIDFEYKGIPSFIKKIIIKNIPTVDIEPTLPVIENIDILPETNEETQHIPDQTEIIELLREQYIPGVITFGDETRNITMRVEKEERFLSHSIEAQVTDIVDTLLSTIPNNQRTEAVLSEVHHLVERYKQLRIAFSKIDEHGSIVCSSTYSENNKPLATLITAGNSKTPKWILPVIAAERKLYSFGDKEVHGENIIVSLKEEYKIQRDYYRNSNIRDLPFVKYIYDVNEFSIPYINNEEPTILRSQQIIDDHETLLVDADTFKQEKGILNTLSKIDLMIQKLTTSSSYTKNETENIKSIVMLRDFMVEYSKINLNNSSIMTRSAMNKNHVSFSRKSKMNNRFVEQYEENNYMDNKNKQLCPKDRTRVKHMEEKELEVYRKISNDEKLINVTQTENVTENKIKKHFENLKKLEDVNFLRYNTNYALDANKVEDDEKYAKFVYTIIPATADLIKLSFIDKNKQLTKNYSFLEFVNQFLEPFMIYSKNIHFNGGYHFIRAVIEEKIKQYSVKVKKNSESVLKQLRKIKKGSVSVFNETHVEEIIKSNQEIFEKNYFGELEVITQTSSTERLSSMFNIDGTVMMSNIIFAKNMNLAIDPSFVEEVIDNVPNEKTTDCPHKFIAKKYSSLDALRTDNGVEDLYYDVGQDDTPYEILLNYTEQEKNDKKFLEKQLIVKHSCPETAAPEFAATLLRGKKRVTIGEYALLNNGDENYLYYKRSKSNKWEIDRNVKYSEFINSNELFCNINSKCVKNFKTKTCDNITRRNVYVTEFKGRLDALDIKLRTQNEKNIEKLSGFITRNNNLKYIQSHRQNFLSVELAKLLTIDNTLKSPHTDLRDSIISHKNFPEKQDYLILFADRYTRPPVSSERSDNAEDKHWLYCSTTNTKLIPFFLIHLANAFKDGGVESYKRKLEEIQSNCGNPDSDGTYFDINSGYAISRMDFSNTDEYTTHSIIDNTEEDNSSKIFHRSTKTIEVIFHAICSNLNILHKEDDFRKFVMDNTIIMIDELETEEQYLQKIKKISQTNGRKFVPTSYDVHVNGNIIYTISSLIFIKIQTTTPLIKNTKTFEECVQSFAGFPLTTQEEDESGIKYLSCAILKLKSSITPWDAIKNTKENSFKEYLKKKINIFLSKSFIKDMYQERALYESNHNSKTEVAPNSISKWVGVLPPIIQFTVKKEIRHIDASILADLLNHPEDKNGNIALIKRKIILYGYAIIESINDIVKSKEFTMKTSSGIPYRQNSCCYGESNNNTLGYFVELQPEILSYIENSNKCENVLLKLRQLSTPFIFVVNQKDEDASQQDQFPKQHRCNIIQAFIHYLKYDTIYPVPSIFSNRYTKPSNYNSKMSLKDKADVLDADKAHYDINALDNLLKTVYSKNMRSAAAITNDDTTYDESIKFNRFITSMIQNVATEDIVQGTAVDVMHNISTTGIDVFKGYILNINEHMKSNIINAVTHHYNDKEAKIWTDKLQNITEMSSWNIYKEDDKIHKNTVFNFVKNAIFNMSKIYPSFINNDKRENPKQTTRWGLSSKHLDDLKKFNQKNLFGYLKEYNDDDKYVFSGDLAELEIIIQLSKNIPHSHKYDYVVSNLLLTYSWLSVFRIFISSASQLVVDDKYDRNHYNKRMIQILTSFLEIETQNKKNLDISIQQVGQNSFKHKQIEKKIITDALKELNSDGRKLMSHLNNIGLGVWRERRIGLVKYDPKAYDRNSSLNTGTEDTEIENEEDTNEYPVADDEEQSGYDNGDGDGNDDNDNDNDN
jgi:hypothetical protein